MASMFVVVVVVVFMDKLQHVHDAAAHLLTRTQKYEHGLSWLMHVDLLSPALAGYSSASAVQACCDSPLLSLAPSSNVPHLLLCASL